MRRHDMNRRRFMLALLVTLILVTYLGHAQAQTNYNGWTASAQERIIKADLWSELYADDFDCIFPLAHEDAPRKWCGIIYDDLVELNQDIIERVFSRNGYIILGEGEWDSSPMGTSEILSMGFSNLRYAFVVFYIPLGESGYIELVTIVEP